MFVTGVILRQPLILSICYIFASVGISSMFVSQTIFLADVVDYGEWKTGVRLDGLTNSATSFGMKVGAGLGSALVGWGLAWASYDGKLAAHRAVSQ